MNGLGQRSGRNAGGPAAELGRNPDIPGSGHGPHQTLQADPADHQLRNCRLSQAAYKAQAEPEVRGPKQEDPEVLGVDGPGHAQDIRRRGPPAACGRCDRCQVPEAVHREGPEHPQQGIHPGLLGVIETKGRYPQQKGRDDSTRGAEETAAQPGRQGHREHTGQHRKKPQAELGPAGAPGPRPQQKIIKGRVDIPGGGRQDFQRGPLGHRGACSLV